MAIKKATWTVKEEIIRWFLENHTSLFRDKAWLLGALNWATRFTEVSSWCYLCQALCSFSQCEQKSSKTQFLPEGAQWLYWQEETDEQTKYKQHNKHSGDAYKRFTAGVERGLLYCQKKEPGKEKETPTFWQMTQNLPSGSGTLRGERWINSMYKRK